MALIAVAATALASCGASAHRPHRVRFGFNENGVAQGLASPEQVAGLLADLGADVDRFTVDWRNLEPQRGVFRWEASDAMYKALLAKGIRPLLLFGFAPPWAAGGVCQSVPTPCLAPPADPADAARAAALVAKRYPRAAAIEIWNEPNTGYFWGGRPDAAAYARLLTACAAAVRAAAPRMTILGGSLASVPDGDTNVEPGRFLDALLAGGAAKAMDVLSVHAYPGAGDATGASAVAWVNRARAVLRRRGASGMRIWVTETGATTTGPQARSEPEQARIIAQSARRLAALPDVDAVLLHTLIDPPDGPGNAETGYGVIAAAGLRHKAAFCSVAALFGAGQCPAG